MNAHPNVYIQINGHTDNTGTAEYNMILSKRRAETVRSYLTKKGIASSRLTVEYFGMSSPITTNDTEEGRNQNRRVEFVIVK
jgi:outer membrane protein OmpA-like peptidoglycan-associated protein